MTATQLQHEQWVNRVVQRRDTRAASPARLPTSLLHAFARHLEDVNSAYSELAIRLIIGAPFVTMPVGSFEHFTEWVYDAFARFHIACKTEVERRQIDYPKNVLPFQPK